MDQDLLKLWREEPLRMQHALWPDVAFYAKQREIIHSVRDNLETIVPAGNMLGKDFVSGFIVLWFFLTHYKPTTDRNWVRVITTSVAQKHLDVLWAEVSRFATSSAVPLLYSQQNRGAPLYMTTQEIRHVDEITASGNNVRNYVKGMVSGKGESMQGHHAEHTLLVIDEASGVEDTAYEMGATWAKRILIIGNPHPCTNFFFKGVKSGDLIA